MAHKVYNKSLFAARVAKRGPLRRKRVEKVVVEFENMLLWR